MTTGCERRFRVWNRLFEVLLLVLLAGSFVWYEGVWVWIRGGLLLVTVAYAAWQIGGQLKNEPND